MTSGSKLREELSSSRRSKNSRGEKETILEQLRSVEDENLEFAERYVEVEEENNNLANLYVASYQLHSTLDVERGREGDPRDRDQPDRSRDLRGLRLDDGGRRTCDRAGGVGGRAGRIRSRRYDLGEGIRGRERRRTARSHSAIRRSRAVEPSLGEPVVVTIPLGSTIEPIGAIAIYKLLQQKDGFSAAGSRAVHAAGGPRGDRDLRLAALRPVRAEAEHDPGLHRSVDEVMEAAFGTEARSIRALTNEE